MKRTEATCRFSKQNVKPNGPGYCIPAPRECETCTRFQPTDLCNTCKYAIGLAPGEECHPPNDSDCPAN